MNTIGKEIGMYTNRTQIVKKSGFVEHKRRRALNQVAQPGKGMTTNNQEITIKKHEWLSAMEESASYSDRSIQGKKKMLNHLDWIQKAEGTSSAGVTY